MDDLGQCKSSGSVVKTRLLLLLPTSLLAAATMLTHSSQILRVPFRAYALVCFFVSALVAILWFLLARWEVRLI